MKPGSGIQRFWSPVGPRNSTPRFSNSLSEKKSLNGFWSRRSVFSNLLAVWDVSLAGITEIEAEDVVEAKGPGPMSSQVRQPFQTLELPPKSWPQIPWRADQRLASFQNLPLRSGMVAGFWVWIFGGFFRKCTVLRFGTFCKKSAENPHPKSAHPVAKSAPESAPKSAPKIRTKIRTEIRTQNPQQNPRPSSRPIPTETHNGKGTRGVLELHVVATRKGVRKSKKKSHQKSVTRLRGKLDGNNSGSRKPLPWGPLEPRKGSQVHGRGSSGASERCVRFQRSVERRWAIWRPLRGPVFPDAL